MNKCKSKYCYVHRDEYLLLFLILLLFLNLFHCCLQRCGCCWMPCVCFCSLSLQIITTCSSFVRAWLRPRGYMGSSDSARRHTSPLLQTNCPYILLVSVTLSQTSYRWWWFVERESKSKHRAFNNTHTFVNNSETNSRTIVIVSKIIINIRPYGRNNMLMC